MKQKSASNPTGKTSPSRDDRLKAALKANMARRKAQAKARSQSQAEKNSRETGK